MLNYFMRELVGVFVFAITAIITLVIIQALNIALPISVTTRTVSGELSVVGTGQVDVVPDVANVQAGIISEGQTVEEVENEINEINNKIIAAVEKLGIDKKDIKTSNYSINPNYEPVPVQFPNKSEPFGYTGNASLTLTIRKQEVVANIIIAATEAGANNVYNAGFVVDDPSKYREEARNKAIENAKEQAEKLSRELGIKLGRIVNIVESISGGPEIYPIMRAEPAFGRDTIAPDIEPGTQTVTSTVTLYFERR